MSESSEKMPPPEVPPEGTEEQQLSKQDKINIEREQEQKLKAKYPQSRPMAGGPGLGAPGGGAGGGGHSAFLQRVVALQDLDSVSSASERQKRGRGICACCCLVLFSPCLPPSAVTGVCPSEARQPVRPVRDTKRTESLTGRQIENTP